MVDPQVKDYRKHSYKSLEHINFQGPSDGRLIEEGEGGWVGGVGGLTKPHCGAKYEYMFFLPTKKLISLIENLRFSKRKPMQAFEND